MTSQEEVFLSQEGDETASTLLEYLMHNCHHDNRSVFRNNLEIIKTLMELWRDRLTVPTKYVCIFGERNQQFYFSRVSRIHVESRAVPDVTGIVYMVKFCIWTIRWTRFPRQLYILIALLNTPTIV